MEELGTHFATERAGLETLILRASAPRFYPDNPTVRGDLDGAPTHHERFLMHLSCRMLMQMATLAKGPAGRRLSAPDGLGGDRKAQESTPAHASTAVRGNVRRTSAGFGRAPVRRSGL